MLFEVCYMNMDYEYSSWIMKVYPQSYSAGVYFFTVVIQLLSFPQGINCDPLPNKMDFHGRNSPAFMWNYGSSIYKKPVNPWSTKLAVSVKKPNFAKLQCSQFLKNCHPLDYWFFTNFFISIKTGLLPFKKVGFTCFNGKSLKMMKNAFYFILKSFFRSREI